MKKAAYTYTPTVIPVRSTVLHERHVAAGAKMAPFAGWDMPIHYPSGIFAEHRAVRRAAGLFDVSHMGVLEIAGEDAEAFLNGLLTNQVTNLKPGRAHYTILLRPDGSPMDDCFLYRLDTHRFLLVVNAANADEDLAWITAVRSRQVIIDQDLPDREVPDKFTIRNLRQAGANSRIDLALQGPLSRDILMELADTSADCNAIAALPPTALVSVRMNGSEMLVARTGYTGELLSYELFLHPDAAGALWDRILKIGKTRGVLPVGLGARDSLRVEAGFPLFGHELAGTEAITIAEAGYSWAVKLDKDFFIGRRPYATGLEHPKRKLVRLRGCGNKSIRAGHLILNGDRSTAGKVTSFAFVNPDMEFIALALVDAGFDVTQGRGVYGYRAENMDTGNFSERKVVDLKLSSRFPSSSDKKNWEKIYR